MGSHRAILSPQKTYATVSRSGTILVNTALNIGAIAGVVCILLAAASVLLGVSPLVFRSGSMAPEITTGSLALAETVTASQIEVGDIITVSDNRREAITHRVVSVAGSGGDAVTITLKGDANPVEDPAPYVITEAKRVFFHVPALGFVAAWASSKSVVFLAGLLSGALIVVAFGPARPGNVHGTSRAQEPVDD